MKDQRNFLFLALFVSSILLGGTTWGQRVALQKENSSDVDFSTLSPGMNEVIDDILPPQHVAIFAPLNVSLFDRSLYGSVLDDPMIVTQHDALENRMAENVIVVSQGKGIEIDLGKTAVKSSYDARSNDYFFHNPWFFKKDNENVKDLPGWWEGAWAELAKKFSEGRIQKIKIGYTFQAVSLGFTTVTFTRQDELHTEPKVLTFRFNIVEAPAVPIFSAYFSDNSRE